MRSSLLPVLALAWAAALLAAGVHNDGFCDDGRDEPLTGACSFTARPSDQAGLFSCLNKELDERIFQSRVGDGVCDCCDGSDEASTVPGVTCPDRCGVIVAAKREAEARERELKAAGKVRKAQILQETNAALEELRNNHQSSATIIPEYERQADEHRAALAEEELRETEQHERRVAEASTLFDAATAALFPDDGTLTRDARMLLIAALTLRSKEEGAEAVLAASVGKYTGEGPDADDTEAIVLAMDSPSDEDGAAEPGAAQSVETLEAMVTALALARVPDEAQRELLRVSLAYALGKRAVRLALRDVGLLAPITSDPVLGDALDALPTPPHVLRAAGAGAAGGASEELRQKIKDFEDRIQRLRDGSSEAQLALSKDFGSSSELFPLFHDRKCYSVRDRQYNYQICPYGDARQGNTLLGAHSGSIVYKPESESESDRQPHMLLFEHGERCMGTSDRRERTLRLALICGDAQSDFGYLEGLEEIEVCVYSATLVTPLVC